MSKKKKAVIGVVCVLALLVVTAAVTAVAFAGKRAVLNAAYGMNSATYAENGERIHFLNTGGSDAILLESNGKFALVDCAEDSDNPRGFSSLELTGYEQKVIDYVKSVAADENGKVTLEFVIGTHCHSDHIGGFDTLITDPDITVKTAYLKRYDEAIISDYEIEEWDNKEVYEQMVNACKERGVELVQDLAGLEISLGEMKVTVFNGEFKADKKDLGENENSLGLLVECSGYRTFLAGDINNIDGDEARLAPQIGNVDVLKLGHHGYLKSSTSEWIKTLDPEIAIVTNNKNAVHLQAQIDLINISSALYGTVNENGVIIQYTTEGMQLFNDIH